MKLSDSAPLRFALGLLLVFLFGAALIFFFLHYQLTSHLERETDRGLLEEKALLLLQYRDYGPAGLYRAIQNEIASEGSQSHSFRVIDRKGRVVYQAGGLTFPTLKPFAGVREMDLGANPGKTVRMISFPVGDDLTAYVAFGMGRAARLIGDFRLTFILTAGLVALFGLALGYWLAWRFRLRIDAFNRHARLIVQSGDLSSRMPVTGNDELSVLAGNMNAMLDRIEKLVQGIRQVSDNIAHDLRTPLTRLRSAVQVALQQEDAAAHRAALERVLSEMEKMQGIFNSLLAISRAESGGMPVKRSVVDFSALLNEMVELYVPSAEDHGLTLHGAIEEGLKVYGNRQLLAQIISNLLDNALKYVPAGGEVGVKAGQQDDRVNVIVEDSGPGIPADMQERVFDRFARLDPSRTMAGSGLGLSLAKAFVELHHGHIAISKSALGGTAFTLDLPAA